MLTAAEALVDGVAAAAEFVGRAAYRIAEALPGIRTWHSTRASLSPTWRLSVARAVVRPKP